MDHSTSSFRAALAAWLLTLASATVSAQLARPGRPASWSVDLPTELFEVLVAEPDVAALLAEDERRGPFPVRYGAVLPVDIDLARHGSWGETPSALVWRASIRAPGARSLGVQLAVLDLPEGGRLFVYSADRRYVLGGFTNASRLADGSLPIAPLPGDHVILEVVHPAAATGGPELVVDSVVWDYRGVLDTVGGDPAPSQRAGCLVDVNCPQAAGYQDIKRAVVALYRGGFVCSGSILNNTAEDGTPYLLTANHCGSMTGALIVFDYERSGCASGASSTANGLAGATLLAADSTFDSQLYLLAQSPPKSYAPFFAGWDLGTAPPGPGISISHPSGLPKKLARQDGAPQDFGGQWGCAWDLGVILGGSSGSPLFNGAKRVIGPACCAASFSCGSQIAFYGKFHRFFRRGGLAAWLDPLGTGVDALDGYDPYAPLAEVTNGAGLNPLVYSCDLPILGASWNGTIDTSGRPAASSTLLVGYAAPDSGTILSAGEVLVDLTSTRLFAHSATVAAGLSVHTTTLPSDPSLAGSSIHTQAVIVGGGLQATNGIELVLN